MYKAIQEEPMPESRPMTPEEMEDFERHVVHHEDPDPADPASESDPGDKRPEAKPPALPLPNPD